MGSLSKEFRKIQMVVFDRFMRSSRNPDEARLLAEASNTIPKDRRVVIVDSDLAYGNARAIALDLNKVLDEDELLFLAHDKEGLDWAKSQGLQSAVFNSKSVPSSAELWDKLIRAKVSVYDTHNWWRTNDQLLQRSLLEGSYKIQLWHGATGPVGKVFGLERLDTAKSFWHFTAVATSSVGFDALVNEPNQAEYRRTRSILAKQSLYDVEYRLVDELSNGSWSPPIQKKILVAPTYSESKTGEIALTAWIAKLVVIANRNNWEVDIALHPGAKPKLHGKIKQATGIKPNSSTVSTNSLRNYSAVVTDFSGIAHDSLMLGIPTVSVLIDYENYQLMCPAIEDEKQLEIAYIVREINELEVQVTNAVISDSMMESRVHYINEIVQQIGALPGVNTREAIMVALDH
ncbi:unannotated protein [freshwater metagenome]|uniref:Unannotated protein n=1 Tax=freshwater metagenome TaxID=449393 RepID=A0A6J5ZBP6_9ZZZZ|nr:hypothetical protein [Actinomycetota bacterium]MSW24721.1 hypothetical protein [Actinomycetota bacterium]MSX28939.1 hypothetical protein [Actinomycetota bacterium]MSX42821.1 hypothetical protein [Actinomycetota bacterium]MSX96684.1 hypothetical protein [Actinomycetota bacterium]